MIINPPIIAVDAGTSPYPIKTQNGVSTGSTIEIMDASTASTLFNPKEKNAYAIAIWNTPRKLTIQRSEKANSFIEKMDGRQMRETIIFPRNIELC